MGPRGVGADHPAEGAAGCRGRVRTEHQAVDGDGLVEPIEDHAGLHRHGRGLRVDRADRGEVTREIDHHARAEAPSREAGAGAARMDGNAVVGADLDGPVHRLAVAWQDDAQGGDLVDRGVRRVEPAVGLIEPHLAINGTL